MVRVKPPLILLCLGTVTLCATVAAQTNAAAPDQVTQVPMGTPAGAESAGKPSKKNHVSPAAEIRVPFATAYPRPDPARSIRILSADEMSQQDRLLEADAEGSIQERAGFQNLGFNEGEWTYHQLVCPALPNHLLLRFSRNAGTREMSMFSAAIPRNGEGRIRIIPIVRKGYSLFSPAPIGPLTISAFNHIRAEEHIGVAPKHVKDPGPGAPAEDPSGKDDPLVTPPDWLGTGLCYAALAGATPYAGQLQSDLPGNGNMPTTVTPSLTVAGDGGATISFVDIAAAPRAMEWGLTFDRNGRLLKAAHAPAYVSNYGARAVPTMDVHNLDPGEKQAQPNR